MNVAGRTTTGDDRHVQTRRFHSIGAAVLAGVMFFGLCAYCPRTSGDEGDASAERAVADLFVDLARDHGLNCHGKQTPADVLRIRTLLRAALRLNPNQTQACVWLYELARLDDQAAEAADMLERLASDPANITAFSNWLNYGPPNVQSVEQQKAWLQSLLAQSPQPQQQALIHVHLARIASQQFDLENAVEDIRQALRLWPDCLEASIAALEVETPDTPPAERLEARLRLLRLRPMDLDTAWLIGQFLDQHEFGQEAREFYEYVSNVRETYAAGWSYNAAQLLDLAQNAALRRDDNAMLEYAKRAILTQRETYEADFFFYWLLEARGQPGMVQGIYRRLSKAFDDIREPSQCPLAIVAQAAWFYCVIETQPQRALMLAEEAARRAPDNAFVRRVLGWAQSMNGRDEDAVQTLTPIAQQDAFAAYELASRARKSGDEAEAARLVRELKYVPPYGRARALLESLNLPMATSQPAAERYPEIPALLAKFDRRIFQLYKNPRDFITADVELEERSLLPGQSWSATFSITNTGPLPITLGPDATINPLFMLSFHMEGDRARDYPELMTVAIDHARVIEPGQTLRIRRELDLGPLRLAARRVPQHLLSVTLSAILDPQQTPKGWRPGPLGYELRSISFLRLPFDMEPEGWNVWFQQLKNGEAAKRYFILENLGELLGEAQRAAAESLNYKPRPIPDAHIQTLFVNILTSESWDMVVHALEALQAAGLDRATLDAAQRGLDNPHWAVRLTAIRLLARQGAAFDEQARRLAQHDPDELVRDMARSYLKPSDGE